MSVTHLDVVDVAKLVRRTLRKRFPGIKFAVQSDRYAGGSSIDVTIPPDAELTRADVMAVVGHFRGATFDGMTDSTNYHDSTHPETGERVHYGNQFLQVWGGVRT